MNTTVITMDQAVLDYAIITEGLTQQEEDFRDALSELGNYAEFFTQKRSAMNKFNHHIAGRALTADDPVRVYALIDFDAGIIRYMDGRQYDFDDLDPVYMSYLNEKSLAAGRTTNRLPATELALKLLDEDLELGDEPAAGAVGDSIARANLQKAFENEMVLMVQLEDYVRSNNLEEVFGNHRDQLITKVRGRSFDYDFTEAVEELTAQVLNDNRQAQGM